MMITRLDSGAALGWWGSVLPGERIRNVVVVD